MSYKILSLKREIESIEELHHYLHIAMEIELSTIPPYLSAAYSLHPDTNQQALDVIHSVAVEEMLHLTLVGNILLATGGKARLNEREFVPNYPALLPDSNIVIDGSMFTVPIQKFSKKAVDDFLRIEKSADEKPTPAVEGWSSIGQFYEGLITGMEYLCDKIGVEKVFVGHDVNQVEPEDYYGSGGEVIVVADKNPTAALEKAKQAIAEIVHQGEGMNHKVMDGDTVPSKGGHEKPIPSHYFRFDEIKKGQSYIKGDTPGAPSGAALDVAWDQVYNMKENPKMADYEEGSEIHDALLAFNQTYMSLLDLLNDTFNKDRSLMMKSVGIMYDLKYKAVALMKIPSGDGTTTVGPSFEYVSK